MLTLYSTNQEIIKDFSLFLISKFISPYITDKNHILRDQFIEIIKASNYVLINPVELRKKFTEFVFLNQTRALLENSPDNKGKKKHKRGNSSVLSYREEIKESRDTLNKSVLKEINMIE